MRDRLASTVLALVAAVIGFGLGTLAAVPVVPVEQVGAPADADCCSRLGLLKSGLVDAVNHSIRGDHRRAQEVFFDVMALAGFRCAARPDPADPRGRVVCE